MVLWQGESKSTETTNVSIRFSWNIWQALVRLGEFEINCFHSLNTLPIRCTSHRIQTSTNVVIHSFTARRGSWLLTTATLPWHSVSAYTQTQISGRGMDMLPGCKYANLPAKWLWVVYGHCSKLHHHHMVDRLACIAVWWNSLAANVTWLMLH